MELSRILPSSYIDYLEMSSMVICRIEVPEFLVSQNLYLHYFRFLSFYILLLCLQCMIYVSSHVCNSTYMEVRG